MGASFFLDGEDLLRNGNTFRPLKFKKLKLFFKGGGDTSIDDTEDQKALANVALNKYNRYQTTFKPIEDDYIGKVTTSNNADNRQRAQNIGAVNTESEFADKLKQEVQPAIGAGVDVGSGAAVNAINANELQKGEARANNTSMSQQAVQDSEIQGYQQVVGMGNGQATEAINGMSAIASESAAKAQQDAQNDFQKDASQSQAIGGAIGYGVGAYQNNGSGS